MAYPIKVDFNFNAASCNCVLIFSNLIGELRPGG